MNRHFGALCKLSCFVQDPCSLKNVSPSSVYFTSYQATVYELYLGGWISNLDQAEYFMTSKYLFLGS